MKYANSLHCFSVYNTGFKIDTIFLHASYKKDNLNNMTEHKGIENSKKV